MQLNITTDYAIRIVSYLAIRGELVNSETIASVMGIPRGYVLKITKKLVRAGIAARVIGAQGGFLLDKGPRKNQFIRNHKYYGTDDQAQPLPGRG